ncbi:hypothetical protein [Gordonia shandongensis]|uniref:hypothetical protein n=1 Tax=Gordonia shandongensis TaxID=376351 RepID=UPI000416101C|nr:hypothetical protein [Gordonia shandongensis]
MIRRLPRFRLSAMIAGLVAIVVAVAATVWLVVGADDDGDDAPATAADVLTAAAEKASARTDSETAYLRTETTRPYESDGMRYSITEVRTVRVDMQISAVTTVEDSPPSFSSPDDWRAWQAAGAPKLPGTPDPVDDSEQSATAMIAGTAVPLADAAESLDRKPADLVGVLADSDPDRDPFTGGVRLLLTPGLPSSAQASILRALATIPDTGVRSMERERVTPDGPVSATVHQLSRPGGLRVAIDDRTGYLASVHGLDDADITVGASGYANCIGVEGPGGPATVYVGCATGAFVVHDIAWDETWGGPTANGVATASVRDCTRSCAEGDSGEYPVTLEMGRQRECGYNLYLYTRLTIRFTGAVPPGYQRTETDDYACGS